MGASVLRSSTSFSDLEAKAADGLWSARGALLASYAPGPGMSSRPLAAKSPRPRTLVPNPPVPASTDLLNDLDAPCDIDPTACELYEPGAGPASPPLLEGMRSDLEAKPAEGALLPLVATEANAPVSAPAFS